MSDISVWSSAAADNNVNAPDGFPENMAPSGVNNASREVMAAVRRQCETAQWFDYGDVLTFLNATDFRISGDVTSRYEAGRRVKLIGTTPFTTYGDIVSSIYSAPYTIVTVKLDYGVIDTSLTTAYLSILTAANTSIPSIFTGGDNASYPSLSVTASRALEVNDAYKILNVAGGSDITFTLPIAPYPFNEGQTFLVTNIGTTEHDVIIENGNGSGNNVVLKNGETAYFVSLSNGLLAIHDTQNDGEINTSSNLGTGTDGEEIAVAKNLLDLPFKRLKAGENVTLTPTTNSIEISTNVDAAFTKSYKSSEQIITYGSALTLAHGFATTPKFFQVFMVCKIAEAGWAIGDEFPLYATFQLSFPGAYYQGMTMNYDDNNIYCRFGTHVISIMRKDTGYYFDTNPSNWRMIVRAWA